MSIILDGSPVNASTSRLFPSSFITRRSGVRLAHDFQPPSAIWKRPAGKGQPHTRVENTFWSEGIASTLKPIPSAVYLYLRSLADENAQCWPSPLRIAKFIGASGSSVRRALKLLEACGLIHVGECFHEGTDENATNLYTLLPLSSFRDPDQSDPTSGHTDPTKATEVESHRPTSKKQLVLKQKPNNKVRTTRKVEPALTGAVPVVVVEENLLSNGTQVKPSTPEWSEKLSDTDLVEDLVQKVLSVGIKPESRARQLVLSTPLEKLQLQLDCLTDRGAKNPAGALVKAVREDWEAPRSYTARIEREHVEQREKDSRAHQEALLVQQREEKKIRSQQQEEQQRELDVIWKSLDKVTQEKIEAAARLRVGPLAIERPGCVALEVERRNVLREKLRLDFPKPESSRSQGFTPPTALAEVMSTTMPTVTPTEMAGGEKLSFSGPSPSRIEAVVWSRLAADDIGIEDVDDLRDTVGSALDDEEWEVLKSSVVKRWKEKLA